MGRGLRCDASSAVGRNVIRTVTPNPAWDLTYQLDDLTIGTTHRVPAPHRVAGGKGVNVSAVLRCCGIDSLAIVPVGAEDQQEFTVALEARDVRAAVVPTRGRVRRSLALVTPAGTTLVNEFGEPVDAADWAVIGDHAATEAVGPLGPVAICGSFPPHTASSVVAELVGRVVASGAPLVVDFAGSLLVEALAAEPQVVKINAAEARETTGLASVEANASALVERGASCAVVTDGARGLVAVSRAGRALRAHLPETVAGNPTGAGDAATAALLDAIARHGDPAGWDRSQWQQALVAMTAWSAAAVLHPVAGSLDPATIVRFESSVLVEELACH